MKFTITAIIYNYTLYDWPRPLAQLDHVYVSLDACVLAMEADVAEEVKRMRRRITLEEHSISNVNLVWGGRCR